MVFQDSWWDIVLKLQIKTIACNKKAVSMAAIQIK
jgi:hypothetical protein